MSVSPSTATLPKTGTTPADAGGRLRRVGRRLALGADTSPRWERPALWGLLVGTGFLYLWNLAVSGYANSFYSAAVQAGSTNWEAFFFGSSDAANSITVDKPPASLWVMELSVRLFGLSSWSILVPEALMGIATVFLVYVIVRRHFSAGAALAGGAVLALTPVAVEMFRFNNPDAMLLLLMTLAVYLVQRGIESGKIRWVVWAGVVVGFGFLTKQLQGFLILPALAAVYAICAPVVTWKRILHLLAALGGMIVGCGWWVAAVTFTPASMRPYVGGSQNNSFLELTFGYNGFGRITGNETGSVTGGTTTAGAGSWGATGITRLFGSEFAGQFGWLLPAALILMVAAFIVMRWRPRADLRRATLLLFASWMIVTFLVFSFAGGIFHPYYTVALAAPIAGTVAVSVGSLWEARNRLWVRIVLAVAMLVTALWAYVLLDRSPAWLPWLKFVVAAVSVAAAVFALLPRRGKAVAATTVALLAVGALLAPAAYSLETASTAHTGSLPSAGPTLTGGRGGFGGGRGGFGGGAGGTGRGAFTRPGGGTGTGAAAGTQGFGGRGGFGGTGTGGTGANTGTGGTGTFTRPGGTGTGGGFAGTRGGGGGGLFGGSGTVSSSVTKLLLADSTKYTWVAAAIGSDSAASYQLATQKAVMPVGGFNGSDPSPTLAQFKADVAAGKIHYFIGGSIGRSNGGSSASSAISAWVTANFSSQTVGGVTLYDLSGGVPLK